MAVAGSYFVHNYLQLAMSQCLRGEWNATKAWNWDVEYAHWYHKGCMFDTCVTTVCS